MDYPKTAAGVLQSVGGEENVQSLVHCATRLRFVLKDTAKADTAAVRATPGVITTAEAGGQYQVVIGNEVPEVFAAITAAAPRLAPAGTETAATTEEGPKGNLLNRFIAMISAIFLPFVWVLAGTGLLKAFLAAATTFGWLDATTTTYTVLNAAGDAFINFLPLAIAITAAKYFNANQFTSLAIAGALVYPAIVALNGAPDLTFLGIPLVMVSYVSSVIPVIIIVWLQGYAERFLLRVLHSTVRRFLTPLIVVTLAVPLTLLVVGPVSNLLSSGIGDGISWIFATVPWLGGAVMGAVWQVLVMFGLHWGLVPVMLLEIGTGNGSDLLAPVFAAVLAQSAATLAVLLRARSASLKQLAGPAAFSGFLAGITEPAIYGVNLPLKKPFIFGSIGGLVGGAIIAAGGTAASAFVFPSVLGIPSLLGIGNVATLFIGIAAAIVIAFTLTMVFGFTEPEAATPATAAVDADDVDLDVRSPLDGTIVPLDEVGDTVFASGALGRGVGIAPTAGTVYAPFAGQVVAVFPTGHAIGLRAANGAELLIHIGVNTVKLGGQHFAVTVEQGQQVAAGDVLIEFDRAAILEAGYDLTSPVIVTNGDAFAIAEEPAAGAIQHGEALYLAVAAQPAN